MSDAPHIAATFIVFLATVALSLAIAGLVRIPNTYVKLYAISKGVVLGPGLVLVAALSWGDGSMILRAILLGAFMLGTTPVSAHAIARLRMQRAHADAASKARPTGPKRPDSSPD